MRYAPPARKRKLAQDLSKFLGLVGAPGDLAAGIVLPANATLYAMSDAVLATPAAVVTINNKPYFLGAGLANVTHLLQYAECSATVKKAAGAPGTITLFVEAGLGKLVRIAQG